MDTSKFDGMNSKQLTEGARYYLEMALDRRMDHKNAYVLASIASSLLAIGEILSQMDVQLKSSPRFQSTPRRANARTLGQHKDWGK